MGAAVLLLVAAACSGGGEESASTTTAASEPAPAGPIALEDVLLTAEDVPEPLGPSAPSDDLTWILQPLCDGRPDSVIPAPEEIVDAGFEGPDDDIWLSSTVARFEEDGAQATIDAYRSEVDRCTAEVDIDRDALGAVGDDALLVRVEHGEAEGGRRWVSRVGDVVIEVSVSWWSDDWDTIDRLIDQGPTLLETVVARAGGAVTGEVDSESAAPEPTEDGVPSGGLDGALVGPADLGESWSADGPGSSTPFADLTDDAPCEAARGVDAASPVAHAASDLVHADEGSVEVAVGRFDGEGAAEDWMAASADGFRRCAAETQADVRDDGDAAAVVTVDDLDDLGDEAYEVLVGVLIVDARPTGALEVVVARRGDVVAIAQVARTDEVRAASLVRLMLDGG